MCMCVKIYVIILAFETYFLGDDDYIDRGHDLESRLYPACNAHAHNAIVKQGWTCALTCSGISLARAFWSRLNLGEEL